VDLTVNIRTETFPSSRLVVTTHPLSDADRLAEESVLAGIRRHFAGFAGTPRETYDAMSAWTPCAAGVGFEAVSDGTVQGCWVRPSEAPRDRAILFVHGGAYALGSSQGYRGLASQIAQRAGVAVFSLEYPLAPEQPFPAAYDATRAALQWLGRQGIAQVALAGDSCGGGLVLSTLGAPVPDAPTVASIVVFSPWVDLALTGASFNDPATHDPIFKPPMLAGAAANYLRGVEARDERASPLFGQPRSLPPLAIQVGSAELLLDDSRSYAAMAAQRGGEVRLDIFEGLHHVFQRAVVELPPARLALDNAADFMSTHWR
jgi:acetyl esterase/lipase